MDHDATPDLTENAIAAAASGDADAFRDAIVALDARGWQDVSAQIEAETIGELLARLGDRPDVASMVNLSQALHVHTARVLNASPWDIEHQVRGLLGAPSLLAGTPRNVAHAVQLAILGCVGWTVSDTLDHLAYD